MKPHLKAELGRPVEGALTSYCSESITASNRKRLPCTPKQEVQLLYYSSRKEDFSLAQQQAQSMEIPQLSQQKAIVTWTLSLPWMNFFSLADDFPCPTLLSIKVLSCITPRNISLLARWWDASWILDSVNKAN